MNLKALRAVIFLTGCCNLIYELALAQMTSSFFGGTLYHYTLNIGLFILSMGLGSIAADRITRVSLAPLIIKVEACLFTIALLMPFYVVFAEKYFSNFWFNVLLWLTNISLGFLSGVELPLFNRVFQDDPNTAEVLFFDYFGMFCGSLAFSFLLFPVFGIFTTLWVAAALNWLVLLLFVVLNYRSRVSKVVVAGLFVSFAVTLFLLGASHHWFEYLQRQYVS